MSLSLLYAVFSGYGTIAVGMNYVKIVDCKIEIGGQLDAPDPYAVKTVGGC